MGFHKDNYFTKRLDNILDIKLHKLIPYFPWKEWCESKDFAMPFPEILALSDHAFAMYTQITGLLLDYTSSAANAVNISCKEQDDNSILIDVDVIMEDVSEVWQVIGINNEDLKKYTSFMVRNYISKEILTDTDYKLEQTGFFSYKIS